MNEHERVSPCTDGGMSYAFNPLIECRHRLPCGRPPCEIGLGCPEHKKTNRSVWYPMWYYDPSHHD